MTASQLEVNGRPAKSLAVSGSLGSARLSVDGVGVDAAASVTIPAGQLAEMVLRYCQSTANTMHAQQVAAVVKRQAEAMAQVVLAAAAAVAARNR